MIGKPLRINGSLKADADGNATIYKARLVAKGFRQVQGVDCDETFSPVAMLKFVRIMLAIAVGERCMGNKKIPTLTKINLGDVHL